MELLSSVWHMFTHSVSHTLISLPFLFVIYLILEILQSKNIMRFLTGKFAPLIAGIMGVFPQCGASIVSSSLFNAKLIKTGTLIAVFLSTSDEFIPLVIAGNGISNQLLMIIVIKVIFAIIVAVILNNTLYRNEDVIVQDVEIEDCGCENPFISAVQHTLKISIIIFISYFLIECLYLFVDETLLSTILLQNNSLQPIAAALIGLIPGCYVSVMISQLFMMGTLSLGSTIAGLSTAAGFGYIILFRGDKLVAVKILSIMVVLSSILGIVVDLII